MQGTITVDLDEIVEFKGNSYARVILGAGAKAKGVIVAAPKNDAPIVKRTKARNDNRNKVEKWGGKWTPEDERIAWEMHAQGYNAFTIAKRLKRTIGGVRVRLQTMRERMKKNGGRTPLVPTTLEVKLPAEAGGPFLNFEKTTG